MTLVVLLFSTKQFFEVIDHVSSFTCLQSCLLNKRAENAKGQKKIQNTFHSRIICLKFVLGNLQKEFLVAYYQNH